MSPYLWRRVTAIFVLFVGSFPIIVGTSGHLCRFASLSFLTHDDYYRVTSRSASYFLNILKFWICFGNGSMKTNFINISYIVYPIYKIDVANFENVWIIFFYRNIILYWKKLCDWSQVSACSFSCSLGIMWRKSEISTFIDEKNTHIPPPLQFLCILYFSEFAKRWISVAKGWIWSVKTMLCKNYLYIHVCMDVLYLNWEGRIRRKCRSFRRNILSISIQFWKQYFEFPSLQP